MKYEDYFSLFLSIEDELTKFLSVIDYSDKHKNIYSHKLVLLLLQACPIIESYLVKMATSSSSVKHSDLWNCDIKAKIWDKKSRKEELKIDGNGNRSIGNFPKFACVNAELFNLQNRRVTFYHSANFQGKEKGQYTDYQPFESLKEMLPHNHSEYSSRSARYPKGYSTPVWWTAYNKIKHDFDLARKSHVNYTNVIEAIAGLFCILVFSEPNLEALTKEGLYKNGIVRTRFFEARINLANPNSLSGEIELGQAQELAEVE
ncbi:hypothetical protein ABL003_000801 [Vibrio parahaemolyticus]|uniref:hypothetical protein n=1 Tax=Vibrio parahaemolyticus TaxID=670 RepID=UPI00084AF672|nr:hypothetical protein [Vibrio parahaemolyticus]ODZ98832.1 hypothetical protein BBM53_22780 [Vibrio parahaemolyticus]OXD71073.1 hypothetical protein CA156_08665 [Vibrio parahaemolyticus]HAS6579654.1 hypothetical protein [Vibrio parahaemolyticus]HAS6581290.1 hypothetical protein [Vibrio parahaemolyticus]